MSLLIPSFIITVFRIFYYTESVKYPKKIKIQLKGHGLPTKLTKGKNIFKTFCSNGLPSLLLWSAVSANYNALDIYGPILGLVSVHTVLSCLKWSAKINMFGLYVGRLSNVNKLLPLGCA